MLSTFRKSWAAWLIALGLVLLVAWPRLTRLNQYIIVDEADRWRWAEDFVYALHDGDLAATLVGDGYPGIVPVWAESIWVFLEAGRRSLVEGQWIGEPGLNHLFHEWDRVEFLGQQRFPIVLLNTVVALAIVWAVWRLFGPGVALVSGLLIALDPFYLSDSRVNRAEALITGLMTLSMLFLIFYYRQRRLRYVILSGMLGGLSLLTKIQALAIAPAIALTGVLIYQNSEKQQEPKLAIEGGNDRRASLSLSHKIVSILPPILKFGLIWIAAAGLTWLILWPSMWVTPLETLSLVYTYTTRKVGAEGISLFFLGQTYQDADPGLLFYPIVFFLRITPLALVGLIGAIVRFTVHVFRRLPGRKRPNKDEQPLPGDPFSTPGSVILVVYTVVYALAMSLGSHKQDRYLMPVFLSIDILAAMGLVYLWVWLKSKLINLHAKRLISTRSVQSPRAASNLQLVEWGLLTLLLIIQLATVLPHHPYYYSYFNPLFGGGQTAVQTLRVGWGEGMDQVGRYLAAKPNSRDLVVSTRFTHNMTDFKGELISLGEGGRWTKADYIVLYIQQVQRRLDPSPGFIDYFQARQPEKVVTIGDIDYAWIYPVPFTVSADPAVSRIPEQIALFGYHWEANEETAQKIEDASFADSSAAPAVIRLFWKNLGLTAGRQLVVRLVSSTIETEWAACLPDPNFVAEAQTAGRFVESLCAPAIATLPPGIYTVEFGLASSDGNLLEKFLFPEGWQAARVLRDGRVVDTAQRERLEAIVAEKVPEAAQKLDRIYEGRLGLAAYQLEPPRPKPGDRLQVILYWQPIKDIRAPVNLTVQLADSRRISLGRRDDTLYTPAAEGEIDEAWLPGNIVATRHEFDLSSDLDAPLAAQVEVTLQDEAEVELRPTTLTATVLDKVVARFTVAPAAWPSLTHVKPLEARWQNGIVLRGYRLSSPNVQPGETLSISLFWEADRPLTENYVAFVHVLDEKGQLRAQSDSLPRAGAYPTLWWQPGQLVEDTHLLTLPADLPRGMYRLLVGLYRPEDGVRLSLENGQDALMIGQLKVD